MNRLAGSTEVHPVSPAVGPAAPFESQLSADARYAMAEATRYFEGGGSVHETVVRISRRLDELGVPFVVVGGVAMFHHGFRRFTEDVDILVTPEDLTLIHEHLDGLGFVRPFLTSRNLRDAANGVRIEFLVTGEFPGDGKLKPVAFPHPREVFEIRDGIKILKLPRLIELKLASYMTGKARSKDLGDVEELIRTLNLPRDFAAQLNPYVVSLFAEKWDEIHSDSIESK
jgi:hypothetical protein